MAPNNTATIAFIALLFLFAAAPTLAVRGYQQPNTLITVTQPTTTDDTSKKEPSRCKCELVRRTTNVTPPECIDYCVWRWAWY
ncbi:uncharacterized protein PV07_02158 [Cladophialophora immunda]|uniref:Uncharacterized protein n=1 Tax=Cladophialophora immunda TaxID=569365 RepID=A0A0D2BD92_9EURO|nr:uncharacterized protein PV07_02158 [Cladophialophora immunda]KIW35462.1 hypothetical protein PV07_02158 [Cladophialophora immunda]